MQNTLRAGRAGVLMCAMAAAACGDSANRADTTAMGTGVGDSAAAATSTAGSGVTTMTDANVASVVGIINAGEIQVAEGVQSKLRSSAIRTYARNMISEHTAMQKSVDSLAVAKNLTPQSVPLSDSLRNAAQAENDRLSQLRGAALDTAYITGQVTMHQQSLDQLNSLVSMTQDADMRSALQGAIPKVQAHLDRARTLSGGAAAGGTMSSDTMMRDTAMRDTTRRSDTTSDTTRRDTTAARR